MLSSKQPMDDTVNALHSSSHLSCLHQDISCHMLISCSTLTPFLPDLAEAVLGPSIKAAGMVAIGGQVAKGVVRLDGGVHDRAVLGQLRVGGEGHRANIPGCRSKGAQKVINSQEMGKPDLREESKPVKPRRKRSFTVLSCIHMN